MLHVESDGEGKGTKVTIKVRLKRGSLDDPSTSGQVVSGDASHAVLHTTTSVAMANTNKQPRVLLVDDTQTNAKLGALMLEKEGCDVVTAFDGLEALHEMQRSKFDLVLMDTSMPVMDGITSVTMYRAWEAEERPGFRMRIFAYTGNVDSEHQEQYDKAGYDGFVGRPCHARKLRDLAQ